jgi:hypothetical protein
MWQLFMWKWIITFLRRKGGKKNHGFKQCLLTKCLWKQGLLFFQSKKWGQYFLNIKYSLFVKIENIMLHTIHKIERFKVSRWIKSFEMFELVQNQMHKT